MQIKRIIPILILTIFSCGEEEKEIIPDNVLSKEEFIPVLVDLQILESHFQRQFARVDLYRDALDSSSQSIFEDHKITKADFVISLNHYSNYPDTLFLIYEAALDTLNIRLDKVH